MVQPNVTGPVRAPAAAGSNYDAAAALQPPFGAYAPTYLQSLLITLAQHTALGRGRARWAVSRMIERLRPGPLDVRRFGLKQRLHYYGTYFVEKKMLLRIAEYDQRELAWLQAAVRPGFQFVDVGANAGIYVLAMKSWAPDARILAIEANPVFANRLAFNVATNGFRDVTVANVAAGAVSGTGTYYVRAESMLEAKGPSFEVPVETLHRLLLDAGFDRIDAMKVDIEGAEDRALPPFFDSAPRSLWPRLLILEAWTEAICDLCLARGYRITKQEPGMNTIFQLNDA